MTGRRAVDDRTAGAYLRGIAMLEIRRMARRREPLANWPDDDFVACIAWLADLCHTMPTEPARRWKRRGHERALRWTWQVAAPEGRIWITQTLEQGGMQWAPPTVQEA